MIVQSMKQPYKPLLPCILSTFALLFWAIAEKNTTQSVIVYLKVYKLLSH